MLRWRSNPGTAVYATARMLVQLLLIGYVLIYIFETDSWLTIAAVLAVMLLASSWIAVRPIVARTRRDYAQALRREHGVRPVYKRVDTCAAEFEAFTPYLYSTASTVNAASPNLPRNASMQRASVASTTTTRDARHSTRR